MERELRTLNDPIRASDLNVLALYTYRMVKKKMYDCHYVPDINSNLNRFDFPFSLVDITLNSTASE